MSPRPFSWPNIIAPDWPDCTRRFQASAPEANVPSAGGIVRVDAWPELMAADAAGVLHRAIHCVCVSRAGMLLLPPN